MCNINVWPIPPRSSDPTPPGGRCRRNIANRKNEHATCVAYVPSKIQPRGLESFTITRTYYKMAPKINKYTRGNKGEIHTRKISWRTLQIKIRLTITCYWLLPFLRLIKTITRTFIDSSLHLHRGVTRGLLIKSR